MTMITTHEINIFFFYKYKIYAMM